MFNRTFLLFVAMLLMLTFATGVYAQDEQTNAWDYVNSLQGKSMDTANKWQPITRGEAAFILAKIKPDTPIAKGSFKDVPTTHRYYKEIMQMKQLGVFSGYEEDQTFRPDAPLTRAQMAKILALYFQLQGEEKVPPFKDISTSSWVYGYVQQLYALNITTGTTATTFSPNRHTLRNQFALFLYRIKLAQPSTIALGNYTLLAGLNGYGFENGAANQSYFRAPQGIVKIGNGYLIADSENHMLRMLQGNRVTTYAGDSFLFGSSPLPASFLRNGNLTSALFQNPTNMVVAKDGSIFVADSANHVIRKITPSGIVSTYAGTGEAGLADGKSSTAQFYMPQGLALAADGSLYIADTLNHVLRKISPSGDVTTLTNRKLRVVKIADDYSEVAGDYADGALAQAKFNEPTNILIDKKGNLFVSDSGNHVIRYVNFANNTVSTYAGQYKENGVYGQAGKRDSQANTAQFNYPRGLALLPTGELFVADSANNAIRVIANNEVKTISTTVIQPSALLIDGKQLIVVQSATGQIGQYTITH